MFIVIYMFCDAVMLRPNGVQEICYLVFCICYVVFVSANYSWQIGVFTLLLTITITITDFVGTHLQS